MSANWEMRDENREYIRDYRDLRVYQRSFDLSLRIHKLTQTFPEFERYELGKQMRRAAVSIPANIAEGYGKKDSTKDFKRFLKMSLGSCNEMLVYHDMIKCLGYVEESLYGDLFESYDILGKQTYNLIRRWK